MKIWFSKSQFKLSRRRAIRIAGTNVQCRAHTNISCLFPAIHCLGNQNRLVHAHKAWLSHTFGRNQKKKKEWLNQKENSNWRERTGNHAALRRETHYLAIKSMETCRQDLCRTYGNFKTERQHHELVYYSHWKLAYAKEK